jgi:hypothetical protein
VSIIRTDRPKAWIEQENLGTTYLYACDGSIMSRDEWNKLKAAVDSFYSAISDEEIEVENARYAAAHAHVEPVQQKQVEHSPTPGYIYLVHGVDTPWFKIGITKRPSRRFYSMGVLAPFECKVLGCFLVPDMIGAERYWHDFFEDAHTNGEWFDLCQDDVEYFLECEGREPQ